MLIAIGNAQGAPGETVAVSVGITVEAVTPMLDGPAGVENDIGFPLAGTAIIPDPAHPGSPLCTVNPAINKSGTAFAFEPPGCTPGVSCTGIRAAVLSFFNVDQIPSGSMLYTCSVKISPTATEGQLFALPCSRNSLLPPQSFDPAGAPLTTTCSEGLIFVGGERAPTNTPLPTDTTVPIATGSPATPTKTAAPGGPRVSVDVGNAEGAPGGTATFSVGLDVQPVTSTLASGVSATATTIPLTSIANFPAMQPFPPGSPSPLGSVQIDQEVLTYSGISGSSLTGVTRGASGSTPASHGSGTAAVLKGVAGTINDITFDPMAPIASTGGQCAFTGLCCTSNADCTTAGDTCARPSKPVPGCCVNPTIMKNNSSFAFEPPDCTPGVSCTSMSALVLAVDNVKEIPTGSTLYTCSVKISPTVTDGQVLALPCSSPASSDPTGVSLTTTCSGGQVLVGGTPLPTRTPLPTGTTLPTAATPTKTVTPGGPRVSIDIGDAEGAPGDTVTFSVGVAVQSITSTLATGISAIDTVIPLTTVSNFPFLQPVPPPSPPAEVGTVMIDDELIGYTGISGNSLIGVRRGISLHPSNCAENHSCPAAHGGGAVVRLVGPAGVRNDIGFTPDAPIIADPDNPRSPLCTVNPAIDKVGSIVAFEPPGCTPGANCTSIRALVISISNIDEIPPGSALYTCSVKISPTAADGQVLALPCSGGDLGNPESADPVGAPLTTTCNPGQILVGGTSLPTATGSPSTPTAAVALPTATATQTTAAASKSTATSSAATPTGTATAPPVVACGGDCHGAGSVSVSDLITLVDIVLGTADASACSRGIPAGTKVDISFIVGAVNRVLDGSCSA